MRRLLALSLLLLAAGRAAAQERPIDWLEAPDLFTARYSADLPGNINESGTPAGRVSDSRMDVFYQRRQPVTDRLTAILGAGYHRDDLFLSGGAPLPSALQSASVRAGGEWKFNDKWRAGATVSPGFYGDTDLDRAGDFKAPVNLFARYLQHPGLVWLGGLAVGFYGRHGVTPFVGVIWQINERWRLNATPPLARLTYRYAQLAHGPLNLFGALGYNGGRYVVGPSLGDRVGRPELDGNTLAIRQADARLGVEAGWDKLLGEFGVGYQFLRSFLYEQADETFHIAPEPYLFAGLSARF